MLNKIKELFLKLFNVKIVYVEKPIVRFMPKPNVMSYKRIFGSPEWEYFIDNCKKKYLDRLEYSKDDKDRIATSLKYEGICFVDREAITTMNMINAQNNKYEAPEGLGLDDETLLREAENGSA